MEDENEDWTPDPEYLALWREKLRSMIRNLKERRLASRVDTSDLVQDALIQVVQQVGSFRGKTPEEFDGWLKSIARGHALNASRFHHASKRDISAETPTVPGIAKAEDGPAEAVEKRETYEQLLNAIEQLDSKGRYVVPQHVFEKLTYAEIATKLRCSASSVGATFKRALSQIRKAMRPDLGESSS